MGITKRSRNRVNGLGQLSLVEHALCPLDARESLVPNLVYSTGYQYSDKQGHRATANARIFSPLGLSASDELYLWGLLALTMLNPEPDPEFVATPHWVLRQLGVINQQSKRGGRQYKQFRESLRRLSAVTYINDAFYDPLRSEHRRVSFSFFSYSLPQDLKSSRAWRIAWDPIFFEMVKSGSGHFRFDLAVYRELDAASRRLFLFVSKVLSRRTQLKAVSLHHVAVELLGFSPGLTTTKMKSKVRRCLQKLQDMQVLSEAVIFKTAPGRYFVRMQRGPYFDRKHASYQMRAADSPLLDTLRTIGFEDAAAIRLIRRFPHRLLSEWSDITQAAIEHRKVRFRKTPMAFLVDSVTKASQGTRTAPDWWCDMKRAESRNHQLSSEGKQVFDRVRSKVFGKRTGPRVVPGNKSNTNKVSHIADIFQA